MRVKVIKNTQIGTDSIAHLIGKEFDVYTKYQECWGNGEVDILHEGSILPLDPEEYEFV